MRGEIQAKDSYYWTWADQLSTYRFWGLLAYFLFSVVATDYLFGTFATLTSAQAGVPVAQIGSTLLSLEIGKLLGFYLAWATARWKTVSMLLLLSALKLIGVALVFGSSTESAPAFHSVGAFLVGIGSGAVVLAIPAIITSGRGGTETFVLAFGTMSVISGFTGSLSIGLGGILYASDISPLVLIITPIFLGSLVLLPVKRTFFEEAPPLRTSNAKPRYRNPVLELLLCLIPLYVLLWIYRAYREVLTITSSSILLSPIGAVGVSLIPFLFPVVMIKLMESLNHYHFEQPRSFFLRSPFLIFLLCILFFPLAIALIQSAINDSTAKHLLESKAS